MENINKAIDKFLEPNEEESFLDDYGDVINVGDTYYEFGFIIVSENNLEKALEACQHVLGR